jgi:hypothetical protein
MDERRKNCQVHIVETRENSEKINVLQNKIFGNGQPGIEKKVIVMETKFAGLESILRWGFGIIAALISGVGVGIILLFMKK